MGKGDVGGQLLGGEENYTRRAVKGTAVMFVITSVAAFVAYLTRVVLARSLSPEEYGLFFAVFTFVSFFNLFKTLGLDYAVVSKIPVFLVRKEPDKIKSALVYSVLIQLGVVAIISMVLLFFSDFLARVYFKNAFASVVLSLLLVMLVFSVFTEMLKKTFQAFQKSHYFAIIELTRNLLTFIGVLILLYFDFRLLSPAMAYPIASFLVVAIFFPIFLKTFPFFKHRFVSSKRMVKEMVFFGIPSIMFLVGYKVISQTDVLVLTYFRSLTEVGVYNVVVPTVVFALFFSRSISWVLLPMSSELWEKKEYKKLADGLRRLYKYVWLTILPAILALAFFSKLFLGFMFGQEYVGGSLAMQILLAGVFFYAITQINTGIFVGFGKPKIVAKILATAAILNLGLNLFLVPKFGMVGAATATTIAYLFSLLLSERKMKKLVGLRFPWEDSIKMLFFGLIFVFLLYFLDIFLTKFLIGMGAGDFLVWAKMLVSLFLACGVYVSLVFLFKVLAWKEVKNFLRLLKR